MKKLMIIMLAIAMLFSFIACDNSTKAQDDQQLEEDNKPDDQQGTPVTPSQGGDDTQPQTETFSNEEIASIAKTIADLFKGDEGLVALFDLAELIDDTTGEFKTCYESKSPYEKITYTNNHIGADGIENVTLTIEGKKLEKETLIGLYPDIADTISNIYDLGLYVVLLNSYSADFTTSWKSDDSTESSRLKASVSGELGGHLNVTEPTIIEGEQSELSVRPDITHVIMPTTVSVSIDGNPVDSATNEKLVAEFDTAQYASADLETDKYTTASAYEVYLAEQAATENQ